MRKDKPQYTEAFFIRTTPVQRAAIIKAAKRAKLRPSTWIRTVCVFTAQKEKTR